MSPAPEAGGQEDAMTDSTIYREPDPSLVTW